jgi:hypothetical protein
VYVNVHFKPERVAFGVVYGPPSEYAPKLELTKNPPALLLLIAGVPTTDVVPDVDVVHGVCVACH